MRVAILNRPREWWPGGDLVEIDYRISALAKLGVECKYEPHELHGFDVVHVFHCNFDFSRDRLRQAYMSGLPFVVTPLYYPEEDPPPLHLGYAHAILPFSEREAAELKAGVVRPNRLNTVIVPNGTSEAFHAEAGPDRAGVCTVIARADNLKNSGLVEHACDLAGLPYEQICGVPPAEMPARYLRFKIFVSASSSERMSLVVGEALCSGCRVFSSTGNRGNEWYPGLRVFDPAIEPEVLAVWLTAAHQSMDWDWDWRPNEAARLLTWDRCAAATLAVYQEAIACPASR